METLTTTKSPLTCEKCGVSCKRFGKHRNGLQRFRCRFCGACYTEEHKAPFRIEDYLEDKRGEMAFKLLVEGCSVRTAERMTGIHRDSILKLLVVAGERCEALLESQIQAIPVKGVEADAKLWRRSQL